jgi:serine protease inhibitor ecotin
MKNILALVLGLVAWAAFADHTVLSCKVEGVYGVEAEKLNIRSENEQCWSDCKMKIDLGSQLQAQVSVSKGGSELRIELLKGWNVDDYGVKSVVAQGSSTLMSCWGAALVENTSRRIECQYCWID